MSLISVNTKYQCALCGKHEYQKRFSVSEAIFSSKIKSFDVLQCSSCGLSSMSPVPSKEDINEMYVVENIFSKTVDNPYKKSAFFNILNPIYDKYASSRRYAAKRSLRLIKNQESISILDVGCSTGVLLEEFYRFNPKAKLTGIEIDPEAKNKAPAYLRDHIITAEFLSFNFQEQFDIVTLSFVIEHLLNFKDYIQKAVQLLKPGGILYISTPDIDSPKARIQGLNWNSINDSRQKIGHMHWFNRSSIEFLAKEFNMTIVRYNNFGEFLYHCPIGVQNFLKKVCGMDHTGERFIRFYAPRLIYSLFMDCIISQHLSYGENIGVYMKKENK